MDQHGNVYSQFGEDRIIEDILSRFSSKDLWACEFGAWDGLHLSNTANLIVNRNYSAVLIEADTKKFQTLQTNMSSYPVTSINRYVQLDGPDKLDEILAATPIPSDFDLLPIDIDGADYWIFQGLMKFRPKVVVIEYNPTIPKEIRFVNPRDVLINQGSSMRSICELAEFKDYIVCGITTCNIFRVDAQYSGIFDDRILRIENLPDPAFVNRIWQTFDGQIHLESPLFLPWHNINFSEESIQVIPQFFRVFPSEMNTLKNLIFNLWKKLIGRRRRS